MGRASRLTGQSLRARMGTCFSVILGADTEVPAPVYTAAMGAAKCKQAVGRMEMRSQKAVAEVLALEAKIRSLLEEETPDKRTIDIEAASVVRAESLCLAYTKLIYYCRLVGDNCQVLATGGYACAHVMPLGGNGY